MLKLEDKDLDEFNADLQELIFDYFNLISKEYYLTIDKFTGD